MTQKTMKFVNANTEYTALVYTGKYGAYVSVYKTSRNEAQQAVCCKFIDNFCETYDKALAYIEQAMQAQCALRLK